MNTITLGGETLTISFVESYKGKKNDELSEKTG